jgi:NADPH:quinone reductase
MKAVYISKFGDLDGLEVRDVPEPKEPEADEVLVRVRAVGLNRADLLQVLGRYPPPPGFSAEIPGLEFAGEISSVGSDVAAFALGDRVFGITAGEAQAEYLRVNAGLVALIPDNLSFTQAAAVPEAFITAHDAMFSQAGLTGGESVLIHAVGSGVGLAALQIARAAGATVIGTSRTADKIDRSRAYGLDHGIIAGPEGFLTELRRLTRDAGVNVILDLVGGAYFEPNLQSLAQKGRLMLVGLTSGAKADFDLRLALRKRVTIIGTTLRGRNDHEKAQAVNAFARDFLPRLANGTIEPVVDRVFSADDALAAYRYIASNQSFGKIVLEF